MHGTPLWVKLLVVVGIAVGIAILSWHLTGGGFGPGSHGTP